MTQRSVHQTYSVSRTQSYGIPSTATAHHELKSRSHYEMNYVEPVAPRPSTAPLCPSPDMSAMDSPAANSKRSAPKDDMALCPPPKIARTMSSSGIDSYNPPDNFALVAGMVYRSSFPKPENFSYLKKLGLKTILTLVSEPYSEEYTRFLKENSITHHQIGMPGNKETSITPVPDEKITAALRIVLDRRNHPILIHCNKGKHRTGSVVGCLRRLQAWSVPGAIKEYRRFAGAKSRPHDQMKIETYRLEGCWDLAREHGWIPSTLPIESDDEEADTPLSVIPAAIKAQ